MLDDLLRIVQTYSPERNATISELFDGIIGALYEAREELDFAQVPRRGAWGSPTAKAFTDSLKTTFQRAIAINQRRRG
jgi:hypothetical protein